MKITTDQQILQKLSLTSLPKEVQTQALEKVNQIVELRMAGTLGELMSSEQRAEFGRLEKGSPEAVNTWLEERFTDLSDIYESILQDYLEEVSKSSDKLTVEQ